MSSLPFSGEPAIAKPPVFRENPGRRLTRPDVVDIFLTGIRKMGAGERVITSDSKILVLSEGFLHLTCFLPAC